MQIRMVILPSFQTDQIIKTGRKAPNGNKIPNQTSQTYRNFAQSLKQPPTQKVKINPIKIADNTKNSHLHPNNNSECRKYAI